MAALDLKEFESFNINDYLCARFSEEKYVFKWSFENFSRAEGVLYKGEYYPFSSVKNIFKVKRYLKNNIEYVVQVEIDSTSAIKCEILICNQDGKFLKAYSTTRDKRSITLDYSYGFCLEHKIMESENFLKNDSLTIIGIIKLKRQLVRESYSYCQRFSPSDYLQKLASDLNGLDVKSLSEKVQLLINGEPLQASKSILCCRSAIFANKYNIAKNSIKDLPVIVIIDDVRYTVFTGIVSFLYTGTIHGKDFQELCDLYDAANMYGIFELRDACADLLWSELTVQDTCRILILSDRHSDDYFKLSLLAYMKFHFEKIIWTSGWQNLMFENPLLAMEVIHFDGRGQIEEVKSKENPTEIPSYDPPKYKAIIIPNFS
ncbi:speckle-type POZ protein B [Nephila pilipes]|uniref:Speckle-type POZ protein B n=1 Tax=Nephila pilipes TaxID=299642 RepID=A0A8X6NW53_NEPPI|nr:speckle-type POZ protein B [Nephila pilipes]